MENVSILCHHQVIEGSALEKLAASGEMLLKLNIFKCKSGSYPHCLSMLQVQGNSGNFTQSKGTGGDIITAPP